LNVEESLSKLQSYSRELDLDLSKAEDRFKWFLAAILFAKRISAETAKETYLYLEQEELTSPDAILKAGWNRLVEVLDADGYARYDFSTATNLLGIAKELKEKYSNLEKLHAESSSPTDLENRLQEFKGVGPMGVNIFLWELRGIRKKPNRNPHPWLWRRHRKSALNSRT